MSICGENGVFVKENTWVLIIRLRLSDKVKIKSLFLMLLWYYKHHHTNTGYVTILIFSACHIPISSTTRFSSSMII